VKSFLLECFFEGKYQKAISKSRDVKDVGKKISALIIVSAKADLSFPNVSIGNPVMCYSEHRFRLNACRNDIVLAETMTKAKISIIARKIFMFRLNKCYDIF